MEKAVGISPKHMVSLYRKLGGWCRRHREASPRCGAGLIPAGSRWTETVVTVPKEQGIFFDCRKWNTILNLSYLPETEEDGAAFEKELHRQGIRDSLDLFRTPFYPQLRRQVEDSWKRLFVPGVPVEDGYAQAALWELRREWIEVCDG